MSDALWCGRRFRTFNVVDDFNREVLAIEVDLNLPASRVVRVLERIVAWRGFPVQIRRTMGLNLSQRSWLIGHKSMISTWNLSNQVDLCKMVSLNASTAATAKGC